MGPEGARDHEQLFRSVGSMKSNWSWGTRRSELEREAVITERGHRTPINEGTALTDNDSLEVWFWELEAEVVKKPRL